jgi:hypothetical protein
MPHTRGKSKGALQALKGEIIAQFRNDDLVMGRGDSAIHDDHVVMKNTGMDRGVPFYPHELGGKRMRDY